MTNVNDNLRADQPDVEVTPNADSEFLDTLRSRQRKAGAICIAICAPLYPFVALYYVGVLLGYIGEKLTDFLEWGCEDRAWTNWFKDRSDAVERHYRVDADTIYSESLRRRRAGP